MKNILLIGDSIRLGYDEYVKESMKNVANVYFPKQNCMSSPVVLRTLHSWADDLKVYDADVVHFNVGHWDTVRIYGDEPLTKLEVYVDNVKRIVNRIRFLFPNAKIIFATSTPVCQDEYIQEFETRRNSDIERYNDAVCKELREMDVIINDLYTTIKGVPRSYFSDQTHYYTADATELLGGQVIRTICEVLDIDQSLIVYDDPQKYHKPNAFKPDSLVYEKKGHIYVQI